MTGVEVSRCRGEFQYDDVRGQKVIEPFQDDVRFMANRSRHLQVHHLSERVDAGIGSAGAHDFNVALKNFFGRLAQFAHDGAGILLILPAAVAAAVVFQQHLERVHSYGALAGGTRRFVACSNA